MALRERFSGFRPPAKAKAANPAKAERGNAPKLAALAGLALATPRKKASTTPEVPKDDPQTPAETPVQDPAAPEEPQAGKTLVVYFSASGHTRQVAQAIAQAAELNKGV